MIIILIKQKKEYDNIVKKVSIIEQNYENVKNANILLKNMLEKEKKSSQMLFDLILQQKKQKEEELYGKKEVFPPISSLALTCLLV